MEAVCQKLHAKIDSRYMKARSQMKQMYNAEMTRLTSEMKAMNSLSVQMSSELLTQMRHNVFFFLRSEISANKFLQCY